MLGAANALRNQFASFREPETYWTPIQNNSSGDTDAVSQVRLYFPASNEILNRRYSPKKYQIDQAALEIQVISRFRLAFVKFWGLVHDVSLKTSLSDKGVCLIFTLHYGENHFVWNSGLRVYNQGTRQKKRSLCRVLIWQNCEGEQSEWRWWRALETGCSAT